MQLECLMIALIFSLFLASRNATDFWLSYMVENGGDEPAANATPSRHVYILNPTRIHWLNGELFDVNRTTTRVSTPTPTPPTAFYFTVYVALCAANTVFTLARAFCFAFSGIRAGKRIHRQLIDNLSRVCHYRRVAYSLVSRCNLVVVVVVVVGHDRLA